MGDFRKYDEHHASKANPVELAMQECLAKFLTVYWEGNQAFLEKVVAEIKTEDDQEKLKALRIRLNDSFLDEDDIDQMDLKATKILTVMERLGSVFLKIRNDSSKERHCCHH